MDWREDRPVIFSDIGTGGNLTRDNSTFEKKGDFRNLWLNSLLQHINYEQETDFGRFYTLRNSQT